MTNLVPIGSALNGSIDGASEALQNGAMLSGISTGFYDLDNRTGGLNPGDLIVVAGRPSMGKSALAINIAYQVAKTSRAKGGSAVALFSLEMSPKQIADRILSDQSEISLDRLRCGHISEEEFVRIVSCSTEIASLPIYVSSDAGLTIQNIAEQARELHSEKSLALIVVDYLQLVEVASREGEHRFLEIAEITAGLKKLARQLQVPIVVVSQIARSAEARPEKKPELTDLLGSASIEHDADVVLFVHREEYYVERQKPREGTPEFSDWQTQIMAVSGKAEVIVGKQRHGPVGTVQLAFESQYTRFGNLAKEFQLPERYE